MTTEKILKRTVISAILDSQLEVIRTESNYYFVQRKVGTKPKFNSISKDMYNKILGVYNIPNDEEVEHG